MLSYHFVCNASCLAPTGLMHAEAELLTPDHNPLHPFRLRKVVTSQAAIFGLSTAAVAAPPHTKPASAGHGQSAVPHFTQQFRNADLQYLNRLRTFSNYSSTYDTALLETVTIPPQMLTLNSSEECALFVLYSFSDNSLNNDVRVNVTVDMFLRKTAGPIILRALTAA